MAVERALVDEGDLKWDARGLVTAVVQHAETGAVLMIGHMNAASLRRTLAGPHVWFWSRSRQELWEKGGTSGNFLNVVSVTADCDGDALLVRALPVGPTCHTGRASCFHRPMTAPAFDAAAALETPPATGPEVLRAVEAVIAARQAAMPDGAYTTYLFREGVDKIAKKVAEEAAEVLIGAKNVERGDADGSALLAGEVADLLYHLLVLLRASGVPTDAVWESLAHRRGGTALDAAPRAPKPARTP